MIHKILVISLISIITLTYGYSTGAPQDACGNMQPQHPFDPKDSDFPYNVTISKNSVSQGEKLLIRISGLNHEQFMGFLVQVRDNVGPVGSFVIPGNDNDAQTLACGTENSSATHRNSNKKDYVNLNWTPPLQYKGKLTLFATVAKNGEIYWVRQKAADLQVL